MPGPQPKHASVRARTGSKSTKATLSKPVSAVVPTLPPRDDPWHPMTHLWWKDVWTSPMAPEYDTSDVHGLYLLATLVDAFWWKPSKDLAGEIRLQRQCFGLTPYDRRRLEWSIESAEDAKDRGKARRTRAGSVQPKAGHDPRSALHAVK